MQKKLTIKIMLGLFSCSLVLLLPSLPAHIVLADEDWAKETLKSWAEQHSEARKHAEEKKREARKYREEQKREAHKYLLERQKEVPGWAPAHGYRAKQKHPSSDVYLNVGRGRYSCDEHGQWRVSTSLPAGISGHVIVDPEKPPKFESDMAAEKYPGDGNKDSVQPDISASTKNLASEVDHQDLELIGPK